MTESHLSTDIALLKQDVATNRDMLGKATTTIDKIGEVASYVAKILAVHDERLAATEDNHKQMLSDYRDINMKIEQVKIDLSVDLERTEARLATKIEELKDLVTDTTKVDALEMRIRTLENWRWILVGGGLVLGILLGNTHLLGQIFKIIAP
ncbi:MAG TPA: hypothetical protein VII99_10295, partial [Bacteroidia bacterium]